jgi:hypothetical protein
LAERAAKSAAKVLGEHDPYIREYAKFLEELESGHAITMPAVEFRKTFMPGNNVVEQGCLRNAPPLDMHSKPILRRN